MTDLLKLVGEIESRAMNVNPYLLLKDWPQLRDGIKALLAENERLKKAADEHMYNCDSNPMGVMK